MGAPYGLGSWNFLETQFLYRGVLSRNFQGASLKTVDFPQDELFCLKNSQKKFEIFSSKSASTTTVAPHGLGSWNFLETQFLYRGVISRNFQRASLKTLYFPYDELFYFKNSQKKFWNFSFDK